MRTDNSEHKALFSIPEPAYSTAIATTKPLPPQRKITGDKQTDAYLWVLEVIRLNEPAHLQAAEDALEKLKITPKEAQKRYSDYLMRSGMQAFQIAFSTFSMDNPSGAIKAAKSAIEDASRVRSLFGSYEQALENTEAEKLMLVGKLADVYAPFWGWTDEEIEAELIHGDRCGEIDEQRSEISRGFREQLPEPHTLSDVVREITYWRELYWLRYRAAKELGYQYGDGDRNWITDRQDYLEPLLAGMKPVSRTEAIEVCKWVLEQESLMDRGELTNAIILNLVGECAA